MNLRVTLKQGIFCSDERLPRTEDVPVAWS